MNNKVKRIVLVAVFSALTTLLYIFVKFPLPIFPTFLDVNISMIPVIICAFVLGPVDASVCVIIRCLIKLPMSSTAYVGELADLIMGLGTCIPCGIIYKFKFNYINHVNERKYELDSIKMYYNWAVDYDSVLLNKEYENPFTATFKERDEDGKLVTDYEYNSFIYITEDEIVQLHFDDLTVFKESSVILDFLVGIFGSSGIGNAIYFYNFSSSKNIDQILETDVNYILHTHQGYYSKPLFGNIQFDGVDDYKTISTTIYATDESEIMVYDQLEKFKAFKTPSNDRLNEFTDKMNITDEVKSKFINYQHSICFLVATNNDSRNSSGEGFVNLSYVENFKISRLKFETNGEIYNSYVADDPDDGGTDFDDVEPTKDWFDEMIDWIKENPLYAVLILLAVIVGLPLIISFLPMILKGIIQLVIGIIKLLF